MTPPRMPDPNVEPLEFNRRGQDSPWSVGSEWALGVLIILALLLGWLVAR